MIDISILKSDDFQLQFSVKSDIFVYGPGTGRKMDRIDFFSKLENNKIFLNFTQIMVYRVVL